MAIPASATFHYRVEVQPTGRAGARLWRGHATTLVPSAHHPGLVGRAPDFELSDGVVSLRPGPLSDRLRRLVTAGGALRAVKFRIGPALEDLLEPGDEIFVDRDHMAALSLCVLRGRDLVLGLGALAGRALPGENGVEIDDDPRTEQRQDYGLAHQVRERRAHVLWIDPHVEPIESSVRRVDDFAAGRPLVIAYRNVEQEAFMGYFDFDRRRRFGSTSYARHPRFDNVDAWRAHLMGLPERPPTDLHLDVRWRTHQVRLAKGDEAQLGPFIVRAEQVNWAIDWVGSTAAVVRQDAAADRTAFRQAAASMTADPLCVSRARAFPDLTSDCARVDAATLATEWWTIPGRENRSTESRDSVTWRRGVRGRTIRSSDLCGALASSTIPHR